MMNHFLTTLVFYSTGFTLLWSLLSIVRHKQYGLVLRTMGGGGGGKGGSAPSQPPPPPPPPPAPTEDAEVVRQRAEQERRRAAAAKGYDSTDITNGIFASGNSTDVPKKPTLLGGN